MGTGLAHRGECMPVAIIVAFDVGLLALAVRRPWLGLTILLAGIPFNGFLLDVIAGGLGLSDTATTALAAWHDALSIGIGVAALSHLLRSRTRSLTLIEWLAGAMLAFGIVAIAISPYRLTALYEYRTLYVPPVLALSLVLLARAGTMPDGLPQRAARVIVGSGVAAALFAGWQVYVGGASYLNLYFRMADGRLPAAYFSAFVAQPRAFGPFHSPNEFGAYLGMTIGCLLVPGLLGIRPVLRSWLLVPIGLALLLTLSRSAWISTAAIVVMTMLLAWPARPARSALRSTWTFVRGREAWIRHGLPVVVFVTAAAAILSSSGAATFIGATVTGHEPSAEYRAHLFQDAVQALLAPEPSATPATSPDPGSPGAPVVLKPRISLLGMGLGTAGPKSARFGESGSDPAISSEVGVVGLTILVVFVLAIVARLWRSRTVPWSQAAVAIGLGLAIGAVGIPVIDEPAVAIPLWSILGLGLLLAERDRRRSEATGAAPAIS